MFGQESMFEVEHPPITGEEYEKNELLRLEKETLGALRLGASAARRSATSCGARPTAPLAELERRRDGEVVTVGGIVGAIKQLTTKKGEPMVFMRLDDLTGLDRGRRLQLGLRRLARPARGRPACSS